MEEHDLSPTAGILLDAAAGHDAMSWLVPGGGAALALGLAADHPNAIVHWQPVDLRDRDQVTDVPANLRVEEPGTPRSGIAAVAIAAPPDRDLARRWLLEARRALEPGGRLILAGANAEGIRSAIDDAGKLFGNPLGESYRAKQRIAVFDDEIAPGDPPEWASRPGIAPGTWEPFTLKLGSAAIPLLTQAGVFAAGRVDAGARLLLDALPDRIAGGVLDVGCGAGVIGIAAAHRGAASVDMTDVNLLAVQAAAENARRYVVGVDRVSTLDSGARSQGRYAIDPFEGQMRVFPSDVYEAIGEARFDLIVSNPPFHRGKAIDYTVADRLIEGAPDHLAPGGILLVVANAFLAYGKRMARTFRQVETVAATRQFHVLRATDPR